MSHHYSIATIWTGNTGSGTSGYRTYERSHTISAGNKTVKIEGSSDPQFRGDKTRYNPEELLLASLSACHMLQYLHLCADNGIIVISYEDKATGTMLLTPDGGGHFTEAVLNPVVTLAHATMIGKATELHSKASQLCFIAASVNFPVRHQPVCTVAG